MTSNINSVEERQLQIKFMTKQEQYALPDAPFSVPLNLECSHLNNLVNELLRENKTEWKKVEFDFIVCGEFLRVQLVEHLAERSISTETTIDVEYLEKYPSPIPQDCLLHDDWVSSIHTHDKWILSACYDNTINIWSCKGKHKLTINEHEAVVKSVAWLHLDDKNGTFISASHDQTAIIWSWDIESNKARPKQICRGHERGIDTIGISPNFKKFVSGSWDTMLKIWSTSLEDSEDEEPLRKRMRGASLNSRTPLHSLKGHKESISSVLWIDNESVCSASMDHTIKIWDVELGGLKTEIVGNKSFFYADYSSLNNLLITASADRHVRLYDPRSKEGSLVKSTFTSHTKWVQTVRWSKSNENLFISGSHDSLVKLWDLRSPRAALFDLTGHEDLVLCCDWSNAKYMVSGGADNTLRIFKSKNTV